MLRHHTQARVTSGKIQMYNMNNIYIHISHPIQIRPLTGFVEKGKGSCRERKRKLTRKEKEVAEKGKGSCRERKKKLPKKEKEVTEKRKGSCRERKRKLSRKEKYKCKLSRKEKYEKVSC